MAAVCPETVDSFEYIQGYSSSPGVQAKLLNVINYILAGGRPFGTDPGKLIVLQACTTHTGSGCMCLQGTSL